jgi:hypothetical protein
VCYAFSLRPRGPAPTGHLRSYASCTGSAISNKVVLPAASPGLPACQSRLSLSRRRTFTRREF